MEDTKQKLKEILVRDLNLEDITADDITDDMPLFGEGLGLDSLDAVELVVVIQKNFGVDIPNMEEGQKAFENINTLATYIEAKKDE